jgi:hypothetical protein
MADLSESELESLTYIIEESKTNAGKLTDWELSFVASIEERYNEYQERTYLSERQLAIIEKIEKKLSE